LANIIDQLISEKQQVNKGKRRSPFLVLDKEERRLHTDLKNRKEGKDGRPMGCQYQYVPANPSDRYGFLPHHPGDYIDPVAEKGIKSLQKE
jgi:hypothetical protein